MKKTIIISKALAVFFVINFNLNVNGQIKVEQSQELKSLPFVNRSLEMGVFYADFADANILTSTLEKNLNSWLRVNDDHSFKMVERKTDNLGFSRSTYQHFYKNIKVADELIHIHEKNKKVTYVNGELSNDININIGNPLTQIQIEDIIRSDFRPSDVKFDDFEQVITKVSGNREIKLYLTGKINALSLKTLQGFDYYVDNSTRTIVKKLEKIHNHNLIKKNGTNNLPSYNKKNEKLWLSPMIDSPSLSTTLYKGNQSITVDSYSGGYRLKDNTRNIHTQDGTGWNGSGSPLLGLTGTITEYSSPTANFTANDTKPAVEVHWGMKIAYDYYLNRHNRNSYDGNGAIIRNYYNINFNTPNIPVDGSNAAALDVQGIVAMVYGNGLYQGQSGFFSPIVGIDVAGHEFSHLIVSRTANLAYEKESGALNESFADMFGTAIEFYSNINPNWTIAEGIPNPALGAGYFRNMSNPNGGSAVLGGQQPDTYQGTFWEDASSNCTPSGGANGNDHCGVHTNSGVGNYWFYLLSVGGSGTNDNGTSYNVSGITIQKAEKIAYRTLVTYLTANSGYANAYTASKQAAIDLYGAGSVELQQVENAWCAVGLGNCANLLSVGDYLKLNAEEIRIYPNPVTNNEFTIESDKQGVITFEIYDLSGKLIKKSVKLEGVGKHKVSADGLSSGVYLIKLTTDDKIISKKIIVK